MKRLVLGFLWLASFAVAQENSSSGAVKTLAPSQTNKPPQDIPAKSKYASNPVVITIKGICNSSSGSSGIGADANAFHKGTNSECKTVVTRTEFEEVADAMNVSANARKQFASWYANTLISANKAHERSLDRGRSYEAVLEITRLQVVAQLLERSLEEEAAKVPERDIEHYYHQNLARYQEATLERLYIPPPQGPSAGASNETDAAANPHQADPEGVFRKKAEDFRARAMAGEDFEKLQAEIYNSADVTEWASGVRMGQVRRSALPASQAAVFDMNPGTVSQLFADSAKGYVFYKLDHEGTFPLSAIHDEIRAILRKQRLQDATQRIKDSAAPAFDEAYFASITPTSPSAPSAAK